MLNSDKLTIMDEDPKGRLFENCDRNFAEKYVHF